MKLPELANLYLPEIERLLRSSDGIEYAAIHLTPDISTMSSMSRSGQQAAAAAIQRVYVLGIVERCHIAAATSLARLHGWLSSAILLVSSGNALGFAASLRGYLEAAADADDVLKFIPSTLLNAGTYITASLYRPELVAGYSMIFQELEQKLIHYAFASRRPHNGPTLPDHDAEAVTTYIRNYEGSKNIAGLGGLYAHLCELTHPARGSVSLFLDEVPGKSVFRPAKGSMVPRDLCAQYESTIQQMVSVGLNGALLSMSMLNIIVKDWPSAPHAWVSSIGTMGGKLKQMQEKVAAALDPAATRGAIQSLIQQSASTA